MLRQTTHLVEDRNALLRLLPKGVLAAEVGVYRGDYAADILRTSQPSRLWLIDCWEPQYGTPYERDPLHGTAECLEDNYKYVLARFQHHDNVHVLKSFSSAAARAFPDGAFDFVYIDANHFYQAVRADLESWWPKIRPGGLLAGHDYTTYGGFIDVKRAVDDFLLERRLSLDYLTTCSFPTWGILKPRLQSPRFRRGVRGLRRSF